MLFRSTASILLSCAETPISGSSESASEAGDSSLPESHPAHASAHKLTYAQNDDVYYLDPVSGDFDAIEDGSSVSFSLSFAQGYRQKRNLSVKANGTELQGKEDIFTVSDVKQDVVITVSVDLDLYAVTYAPGEELSFASLNGSALPSSLEYGSSLSFKVEGSNKHSQARNAKVTVNDLPLGRLADGSFRVDGVESDIVLSSSADLNAYAITCHYETAEGEASKTYEAVVDDSFTPEDPGNFVQDGITHRFLGWYDEGGNKVESFVASGDVTLTARYDEIVSVEFPDEEDFAFASPTGAAYAGSVELNPGDSLSFEVSASGAYSQKRNLVVTANGETIDPVNGVYTITAAQSVVIAVAAELNQYTVTLHNAQESGEDMTSVVSHGDLPSAPTSFGMHIFDKWVDGAGNDAAEVTSETELTARWKVYSDDDASDFSKLTTFDASYAPTSSATGNDEVTILGDNYTTNEGCLIEPYGGAFAKFYDVAEGDYLTVTLPAFDFSSHPATYFDLGAPIFESQLLYGTAKTSLGQPITWNSSMVHGLDDQPEHGARNWHCTVSGGVLSIRNNSSGAVYSFALSDAENHGTSGLVFSMQRVAGNSNYMYRGIYVSNFYVGKLDYLTAAQSLISSLPDSSSATLTDEKKSSYFDSVLGYRKYAADNFTVYEQAHYPSADQTKLTAAVASLGDYQGTALASSSDGFATADKEGTEVTVEDSTTQEATVLGSPAVKVSGAKYSADETMTVSIAPLNFSLFSSVSFIYGYPCWNVPLYFNGTSVGNTHVWVSNDPNPVTPDMDHGDRTLAVIHVTIANGVASIVNADTNTVYTVDLTEEQNHGLASISVGATNTSGNIASFGEQFKYRGMHITDFKGIL